MILWVHNIFYKYIENNILFSTKMKLDDSYIWRSIVKVKNMFNVESQAYDDSFNAVKRMVLRKVVVVSSSKDKFVSKREQEYNEWKERNDHT